MKTVAPEKVGLSSPRLERVGAAMQRYVDEGKHAGITTLIARHGRVAHLQCFGAMDVEAGRPMQPDTIFRIYSMTKPITSVALMMLYDEGLFQLNDPVSRFIPEFAKTEVRVTGEGADVEPVEQERPMTVRHLLTHTSGLDYAFEREDLPGSPEGRPEWKPFVVRNPLSLAEFVHRLAGRPLAHHPGTVWEYGWSTDVVGRLVEIISGSPFDVFLRERIFEPLGMDDTGFCAPAGKRDRLAAMYYPAEGGGLLLVDPPATSEYARPPVFLSGGGELVSTAADYARFAQLLLNRGELGGVRLLGRKTVELMTVNHLGGQIDTANLSPGHGFGLGVQVLEDVGQAGIVGSVGSYGWDGAAGTRFWVDPREDLLAIVLTQLLSYNIYSLMKDFVVLTYQAIVD